MPLSFKEKYIYRLFEYSLGLKLFNSAWEIILGFIIIFDKDLKNVLFVFTSRHHDFVFRYFNHFLLNITHGTEIFIAVWLLFQGFMKIFLIAGMFKKQLWAYPTAITAFFAFIFYYIYRFNHTHAPFLIVSAFFDLFTILLVEHEWKRAKKHLPDY